MLPTLRSLTLLDGYFVPSRSVPASGANLGFIQYMDEATRRQFSVTIYKSSNVLCRHNGFEHLMRTAGGRRICFVDGLDIRYSAAGVEYIFSYASQNLSRTDGTAAGAYGRWAMTIVDSYRYPGTTP